VLFLRESKSNRKPDNFSKETGLLRHLARLRYQDCLNAAATMTSRIAALENTSTSTSVQKEHESASIPSMSRDLELLAGSRKRLRPTEPHPVLDVDTNRQYELSSGVSKDFLSLRQRAGDSSLMNRPMMSSPVSAHSSLLGKSA